MVQCWVHPERIKLLNGRTAVAGDYVLYWMQQSQRAVFNPALNFAVEQANHLGKPVVVAFGLMGDYPEAQARHYRFMLEGLRETAESLRTRGIGFVCRIGPPPEVARDLGQRAALIVCDRAYLAPLRRWRQALAEQAACAVYEVDADSIVPVDHASTKAEVAARTLRPKLNRRLTPFLVREADAEPTHRHTASDLPGESLENIDALLTRLTMSGQVASVPSFFSGGTRQARARLARFSRGTLAGYADRRNQPHLDAISQLSAYLQYGQISPVEIAITVRESNTGKDDDRQSFLEELVVRRELAHNYVWYTPDYGKYSALPAWARATLDDHRADQREFTYDIAELETARTHDEYWNAAMREAILTGYMHNHMRMYWGKKILEWSATPEDAFAACLQLNNRYFLDGLSANSYANVAWIFGQHDRPWPERAIFGKVRYMNANGLKRKCDMPAYLAKVHRFGRSA